MKEERILINQRIKRIFTSSLIIFFFVLILFSFITLRNLKRSVEIDNHFYSSTIDSIIQLNSEKLEILAEEYSKNEKIISFITMENDQKQLDNIFKSLILSQDVDFVAIYSNEKSVYINCENKILHSFLLTLNFQKNNDFVHSYELSESLLFPFEYYAYPILKKDSETQKRRIGTILLGRFINIERLLELERLTASKITFETDPKKTLKPFGITLTYSKPLKNSQNKIIGYIVAQKPSEAFKVTFINLSIFTIMFILLFIFLLYMSAYFVTDTVVTPLQKIEYAIQNNTPDVIERYVYQKDEIGELSRAIKHYLEQKEQINIYLKELESKNASLRMLNEEVRKLLEKDTLTGLLTRYVFNSQIERLYVSSKADKIPLSAISIDADNFKKINDTYGHAEGDEVLKKIGEIILKNIRLSDFPIRMGGEEILILLPEADINAAYSIAERIRNKVQEEFKSKPYTVTISLGVTQLKPEDTIETFLKRADDALYVSKTNGKNQTTIFWYSRFYNLFH